MGKIYPGGVGWRRLSTTSSIYCTISKRKRAIISSRVSEENARAPNKVELGMAHGGCHRLLLDSLGQTAKLAHRERWCVIPSRLSAACQSSLPSRFEFVVSLKIAKAIDLMIPQIE
jgi:hypothetical protein